MSGRKRLACGTRKIGVVPAETLGRVKRKRKSQLCDDYYRFRKRYSIRGLCVLRRLLSGDGRPTIQMRSDCEPRRFFGSVRKGENSFRPKPIRCYTTHLPGLRPSSLYL